MKILDIAKALYQDYFQGHAINYSAKAILVLMLLGAIYGIYKFTMNRYVKDEPEGTAIASALNKSKLKAKKKKIAKKSIPSKKQDRKSPSTATANSMVNTDNRPQQGKGEPKHFYKIEPFGKISAIRVYMEPAGISEEKVRQTAIKLSSRLINDADRFLVSTFDDEACLDNWDGDASVHTDDKEHCHWHVSTISQSDKTFKVESCKQVAGQK